MDILKQLKKLIKKYDITISEIARRIGVSRVTIYRWLYYQKDTTLHKNNLEKIKFVLTKIRLEYE